MKILINTCYGGFGLSNAVWDYLGFKPRFPWEMDRANKEIIAAVEAIGLEASAEDYAELKIVEIPDGVDYIIQEYDGVEWIAEKHRVWS